MVDVAQLAADIAAKLRALTDESYRDRIKTAVPTTDGIMGVPVPRIRELAKGYVQEHKQLPMAVVCRLLDHFGERRFREGMLFSTFVLTGFRRRFDAGLWPHVDRWVDMIDNWETCDQMATNLAAEVVVKQMGLIDDLVRWAQAPNPWRRRFAAAVTTALNQRGRSHPLEALRVCEPLMKEPEVIVQKAVAWAIREASQQDVEAVYQFLARWKGKAQPRIMREGAEKLPEEYRKVLRD